MGRCIAFSFLLWICILISSSSSKKVPEEAQKLLMELDQTHCNDDTLDSQVQRKNGVSFQCTVSSEPQSPTSVHQLRPEDIDIVGAIGDSYVAAFGANANYIGPGAFKEYRGLSFAAGGDGTLENHVSIPNILKKYNPNVYGFSLGVGTEDANLNVAITGGTSDDFEDMVDQLIENLVTDPQINMEEDWKLINIFLGGNDIFDSCVDSEVSSEKYRELMTSSFNTLKAMVPRALVNVIAIPDGVELKKLTGPICDVAHMTVCPCLLGGEDVLKDLHEMHIEFNNILKELVTSGEFDTDDFAMVYQPLMGSVYIPVNEDGKPDDSFFAPDCIHLSVKGHASGAYHLWANMLEPVNAKNTDWSPEMGEYLPCPKGPYIYTNRNSVTANVAGSLSEDTQQLSMNSAKSEHLSGGAITTIVFLVVSVAFVSGYLIYDKVLKYIKFRRSYEQI